jgi:hypothetical protein
MSFSDSLSTDFVDVPIVTDAATIGDTAVDALGIVWPGWAPADADLTTVLIETLSPMAQAAAVQASQMPGAALRAFGTKLLGVAYQLGSPATTTVTFAVGSSYTAGEVLPGGSQIQIDNYAFNVIADTAPVAVGGGGWSLIGVPVQCAVNDEDSNGLTGDVTAPISLPGWIDGITVVAPTANAIDPMDDDDFQGYVSNNLQLRSVTYTTAADFVLAALNTQGVGYAVATGNQARVVTVGICDPNGIAVSAAIEAAYVAEVSANRMVNLTVNVYGPTYTPINVAYTVKALPGFVFADLINRINATLVLRLSAAGYLNPPAGESGPNVDDPIISAYWLIGVISGVAGVDRVTAISLIGDPNYVLNPTPGHHDANNAAPAGWAATATIGSVVAQTAGGPIGNGGYMKVVTTAAAAAEGVTTQLGVLPAGEWTVSFYADSAAGATLNVAAGPAGAPTGTLQVVPTAAWEQYSLTFTADGVTAQEIVITDATAAVVTFGISAVKVGADTQYTDGDTAGYGWGGTAGDSVSQATQATAGQVTLAGNFALPASGVLTGTATT